MHATFKGGALGLAIFAAFGLATTANAAVDINFGPGLATPAPGYTIVDTFDTAAGLTGTNFQIKFPPADSNGSPPANSFPSGTPYLSVLSGGSATFTFASPVSGFQFDWGSINSFNMLTINGTSPAVIVPGSNFINPANGDPTSASTNGRFTVTGTAGELFTSVTFSSTENSFEVDNLAVASATAPVPEPATWGLMMLGFGAIGVVLRRRHKVTARIRLA